MFRRSADAVKALSAVRSKGFKDAFIVALTGTRTISSDRASVMEKEWGMKPFEIQKNQNNQVAKDTIPPTLSFRVEIMRSAKPLKADVADGIKKIAGNRPLEARPLENGEISYLIGKFITFESAAEYSDLVRRNGYNAAKVVAFLGEKEIPAETAKQLMDKAK
jgi:hypothetical protein